MACAARHRRISRDEPSSLRLGIRQGDFRLHKLVERVDKRTVEQGFANDGRFGQRGQGTVAAGENHDFSAQGREVFIVESSDYGNAVSLSTVLSIPYVLDRLVPQLAAAVDGKTTTKVEQPAS